ASRAVTAAPAANAARSAEAGHGTGPIEARLAKPRASARRAHSISVGPSMSSSELPIPIPMSTLNLLRLPGYGSSPDRPSPGHPFALHVARREHVAMSSIRGIIRRDGIFREARETGAAGTSGRSREVPSG